MCGGVGGDGARGCTTARAGPPTSVQAPQHRLLPLDSPVATPRTCRMSIDRHSPLNLTASHVVPSGTTSGPQPLPEEPGPPTEEVLAFTGHSACRTASVASAATLSVWTTPSALGARASAVGGLAWTGTASLALTEFVRTTPRKPVQRPQVV